jgi:hypothetical protein
MIAEGRRKWKAGLPVASAGVLCTGCDSDVFDSNVIAVTANVQRLERGCGPPVLSSSSLLGVVQGA